MEMGWLIWLLVACGFGAAELLSGSGFFLAPFAIGAAAAAVANAAGGELAGWGTFLLVSVLTLMTVRPIVMRRYQSGPALRTGGAALVGKQAVVLERIANHEGLGQVRIDGEIWTARSFDDERVIEAGVRVEIVDIRGATALVME
jgi:membrane protein implicated in regulation of membrane protease activity